MGRKLQYKNISDRYIIEPNSGCWLWLGAISSSGYGTLKHDGKTRNAHTHVYLLHGGIIPEGKQLDHLCRERSCVNPIHLQPVSARENLRRACVWDRLKAKEECKNGHPFNEKNTRYRARGSRVWRVCRLCHKLDMAKRRAI